MNNQTFKLDILVIYQTSTSNMKTERHKRLLEHSGVDGHLIKLNQSSLGISVDPAKPVAALDSRLCMTLCLTHLG